MRVVDTSAWVEWLTGSTLGRKRAAELHRQHKLAAADAIVYATARVHGAELLTCDAHLAKLPGVLYFAKPKAR